MVAALDEENLHFDVSVGLKRVLGRELITDDEVAIFEMVKNSFDAGAYMVHLYFDELTIIVADDGSGMTLDDLRSKWLFVAYSAKREQNRIRDFRDKATDRGHLSGSKGVGRFSSDRLGDTIILQTRAKTFGSPIHRLEIDWSAFEVDDKRRFETVPVAHKEIDNFVLPNELESIGNLLAHGTVIEIGRIHHVWRRQDLQSLKAALAKLINPFGSQADRFAIHIVAPGELGNP